MTEQEKRQAILEEEDEVRQPDGEEKAEAANAAEETAEPAAEQSAEPKADGGEASGEPTAAERELEAQRKLADEHYQRYLRTQADFDNFRRRSRQEKEDFAKYASAKLIEQLLPIVDNFERALAASKDNTDSEALLKGVDMIHRQLEQVLAQEGLKPIEAVGQPFNPEYHQAIMQVESEDHEEGVVLEEVQKGYILKDKVIRPAMVKVSG